MKKLLHIIFLVVLLASCETNKGKNIPSLDGVMADVDMIDFLPERWSMTQIDSVVKQYPILSEIYFGHLLSLPLDDSLSLFEGFAAFMESEPTVNIRHLIDSVYANKSGLKEDWQSVMGYYEYYFPQRSTPNLYLMQTNLGIANFLFQDETGRDGVGASLDFFLGAAFPYIQLAQENPAFSDYNNRTFNRDHLITKSVNAIVEDIVPLPTQSYMLSHMIREGKRVYILEQICANKPDSVIFELTDEQVAWCDNNEFEIWNFFVENELLYEISQKKFFKYIKPAPNSAGMPESAPGKTGVFIGYKIVQAFMQKQDQLTLRELANVDDQMLFDRSGYKPRRR